MALNLLDKYKLLDDQSGIAPDTITLLELVTMSAINNAMSFRDNHKNVDEQTNPLAQAYLNKMLNLCRNVIQQEQRAFIALHRVMVELIGDAATDLAQVQGASDTQWQNFVENNINSAFQHAADTRQAEETDYTNL